MWSVDASRTQGIVEPIAITMNNGTRGLCGADEQAQGKKKKKKGGLSGPAAEPPTTPTTTTSSVAVTPMHACPTQQRTHTTIEC